MEPFMDDLLPEIRIWRRQLHQMPELGFSEKRTARYIADRLTELDITVHGPFGGTGLVGELKVGDSPRAIGLRAELDALPMTPPEEGKPANPSIFDGNMHACGHDGHMAILLGAAAYLARSRDFNGTVYFIFQPAEENFAGARKMLEDGLLARFPMQGIYGLHNWPGLPVGQFASRVGAIMAAVDIFNITINGQGGHGAMPHLAVDPMMPAIQAISAFQKIISRQLSPLDSGVISVTRIRAGETFNIIPDHVEMLGSARSLTPETRSLLLASMERVLSGTCAAHACTHKMEIQTGYPATINSAKESAKALQAAALVEDSQVVDHLDPSMGSEDFSFFLEQIPGNYMWLGNGTEGAGLHSPHYRFNEDLIPLGVGYWVALVGRLLG
ncbi:MAG: amidohydrolase [Magnetococcales bacterium]|nr:amidohydrolase [Magnetococcales bacterium]